MVGHCQEVLESVPGIEFIHEHVRLPDVSRVSLFSSQTRAPLRGTEGDDCRKFVSTVYTSLADFPSTVEAVYAAGHRVFVELGPNNQRAQATASILQGRPHVAVAFDNPKLSCW